MYPTIQKDDTPLNTIQRARGLLTKYGLLTTETNWTDSGGQFYSCQVELGESSYMVSGKGLTKELALASAYGELMERYQNFLCGARVEFSDRTQREFGFKFAPDEVQVTNRKAPPLPDCFEATTTALCFSEDGDSIAEHWRRFKRSVPDGLQILLPFYNLADGQCTELPISFLSGYYNSNGMSAGNSPYETLAQAMAEVMERHVIRTLYLQRLTPPTIPHDLLREVSPNHYKLIKEIEAGGRFQVIIKDGSLGVDLPVIGVLVVDKVQGRHTVCFGSDADQLVALERALTELLQGITIKHLAGIMSETRFDPVNPQNGSQLNPLERLIRVRQGRFPVSFYSSQASYPFTGFSNHEFDSTKAKLHHCVEKIRALGFENIYIRDNSVLGFPAYYVLIPGCSEVACPTNRLKAAAATPLLPRLQRLDDLAREELEDLVLLLTNFSTPDCRTRHINFLDFLPIPLRQHPSWKGVTIELVLAMIYIAGALEEAH